MKIKIEHIAIAAAMLGTIILLSRRGTVTVGELVQAQYGTLWEPVRSSDGLTYL